MRLRGLLSTHHVHRPRRYLLALITLAALLQLGAGAGLGYLAGWRRVTLVLHHLHPVWLAATVGALAVSLVGYYFAYRSVYQVEGGPRLPRRQMWAVVAASFAGFLSHGGEGIDGYALRAAGAGRRESTVRVSALAGMEQVVLAVIGCGAAIAVLVTGLARPPASFTLPWALIPVPAMLLAFAAAERYRDRLRARGGWRGKLAVFLDSIHLVRELHLRQRRYGPALPAMGLFWAADGFAAWAGIAAAGVQMNFAALLVGYATGLVFSRRTGPLGGAGVMALVLPLAVSYSGVGLPVAAVGLFCYRVLGLWLPLPLSLATLPTLRRMDESPQPVPAGAPAADPATGQAPSRP